MSKETKNNKEVKNSKDKRHFFKDFKAELKKVIWPTPKQLVNNTVAVITIVLITALIVFVLDITFESINKYGVDRIRAAVESSVKNEENTQNTTNTTNETNTESGNTVNKTEGTNVQSNTTNAVEQSNTQE